jgi:hypothetical protein
MPDLDDLVARIRAMSESDRFRLVAELIDVGKLDLAYQIADETKVELGARLLLRGELRDGRARG